jgi:hypothetical protein
MKKTMNSWTYDDLPKTCREQSENPAAFAEFGLFSSESIPPPGTMFNRYIPGSIYTGPKLKIVEHYRCIGNDENGALRFAYPPEVTIEREDVDHIEFPDAKLSTT